MSFNSSNSIVSLLSFNSCVAYKRVRSSSGQSQNCVRLGTSRDKTACFKLLRVEELSL